LPAREPTACFLIGMKAVKAAQVSLINAIARGELNSIAPVQQDRSLEIRYSRNAEFTDEVAAAFISRNLTPAEIGVRLKNAPARDFVRPRFV
jgi:hypothetical protein